MQKLTSVSRSSVKKENELILVSVTCEILMLFVESRGEHAPHCWRRQCPRAMLVTLNEPAALRLAMTY